MMADGKKKNEERNEKYANKKKIKEGAEYVKSHSSMARGEGGANT